MEKNINQVKRRSTKGHMSSSGHRVITRHSRHSQMASSSHSSFGGIKNNRLKEEGGGVDDNDNEGGTTAITISPTPKELAYKTHPYLLYFTDPDTEQRYFDFQYVDNAFIPGKMFALMWVGLAAFTFILYTEPFENNASYTAEAFSSKWWIGVYVTTFANVILSIGLFPDSLRQYREIVHLLQIFIGYPTQILLLLIAKKPQAYTYGQLFGCSFFCMVIVQCRICRSLPLVTVWPILCLLIITFSVPDYWDHHNRIEMLYWATLLLPVLLLSFLEKRTRKSFVDKELANASIVTIEHKTAVTQRMIANFFPATPTRDLLQIVGGSQDKAYPGTVLVVTDIAGFTAFTACSSPPDVIEMLAEMFRAFDKMAPQYNVEKIATVGDSYCGAIFTGNKLQKATCCTNGIVFGCSTLGFAGSDLELRVGVHIGDVVGVFVGRAPPKFDLFGPGMDHARVMEERGRAGYVHVSRQVLDIVTVKGDTSTFHDQTEFGATCNTWSSTALLLLLSSDDEADNINNNDKVNNLQLDSGKIVESLCVIAGIDDLRRRRQEGVSASQSGHTHPSDTVSISTNTTAAAPGTIITAVSKTEDILTSIDPNYASKTEEDDDYSFHFLLLRFYKDTWERHYQRHLKETNVNSFVSRLILSFCFGLFVIQLNLQCGDANDMGVASSMLAILALMSCYIQFIGTNNYYHAAVTYISYNALFIVPFLGLTADCGGLELREKYVGDIAACYLCIAIFAPQYCLDVRLMYRCAMTISSCVLWIVCIVIRRNTYQDEVGKVDPLPICGLAFVIMSFFPDYSLRSAFRTEMQLRRLQKAAKSRGAAMATSALSIMLPTFVTERIVMMAQEAKDAGGEGGGHGAASLASVDHNDVIDIDFDEMTATWEYNHAVVMFAKFHSDSEEFTPDAINMTVQAIEQVTLKFQAMKVKTIGSTVMLVAGIDDPRTRQEQLTGIVDAAITIRTCVFQQMNVPDLEHRIGVHCGPCFGAVIGGNGAVFDLFGDTVNTASRMCTTATSGSIQLSSAANALLMPRLREVVVLCPPVSVKGKGTMEVFGIRPTLLMEELGDIGINCDEWETEVVASSSRRRSVKVSAIDAWRTSYGRLQHHSEGLNGVVFLSVPHSRSHSQFSGSE